jgi:hypothetical protein
MWRAAELSLQKGFIQLRFEQATMAGLGAGGSLLVGHVSGRHGYLVPWGLSTPIYNPQRALP